MSRRPKSDHSFVVVRFPRSRLATFDFGYLARKKHVISALIEVDVTRPRALLRASRRTEDAPPWDQPDRTQRSGRAISFLAWFLFCASRVCARHPEAHAIRRPGRKLDFFEHVDMGIPVERVIDGVRVPVAVRLPECDLKSLDELQEAIERARSHGITGTGDFTLNSAYGRLALGAYYRSPGFIRRLIWRYLLADPVRARNTMGTVMVTATGVPGRTSAFMVPTSVHNLCLGIGSISRKPWVVIDGHGREALVPRTIMNLTVLFDHDVLDGAPAARFVDDLVRDLERGAGLNGSTSDEGRS